MSFRNRERAYQRLADHRSERVPNHVWSSSPGSTYASKMIEESAISSKALAQANERLLKQLESLNVASGKTEPTIYLVIRTTLRC